MKVLCFAHYDPDGKIRKYVHFILDVFRNLGYEIHFVSTASLDQTTLASIKPLCATACIRENAGYDFGSWKKAILGIDPANVSHLLLLNSSIIGPVFPVERILDVMEKRKCDFWGVTESWEIRRHLQSYFLGFKHSLLVHPCFAEYWRQIEPAGDRQSVINRYELGLADYFKARGFRAGAYLTHGRLRIAHLFSSRWNFRKRGNPTLLYPDLLLKTGVPFIKLQLLRENPGSADLRRVSRLAEASFPTFRDELISDLDLPAYRRTEGMP